MSYCALLKQSLFHYVRIKILLLLILGILNCEKTLWCYVFISYSYKNVSDLLDLLLLMDGNSPARTSTGILMCTVLGTFCFLSSTILKKQNLFQCMSPEKNNVCNLFSSLPHHTADHTPHHTLYSNTTPHHNNFY